MTAPRINCAATLFSTATNAMVQVVVCTTYARAATTFFLLVISKDGEARRGVTIDRSRISNDGTED